MFKLALVFLTLVSASMAITNFRSCRGGGSLPNTFEIPGCAQAPCTFVEGQNLVATAQLTSPYGTNTVTAQLKGYVGSQGADLPLPPNQRDGCANISGNSCPLAGGANFNYRLEMPVTGAIKGNVILEHSLLADNSQVWLCVEFDAIIQ